MGKGKARAATGLTEVVCWQFMLGGVGGVGALIFFLVLGAMNGMEPKAKPAEVLAPAFRANQCIRMSQANRAPCSALKQDIDAALSVEKKTALLTAPCTLPAPVSDTVVSVVANLGFFWQAVCRDVYDPPACTELTDATCVGANDGTESACALNADSTACAVVGGDCEFAAREVDMVACEQTAAINEAHCAFLGLSPSPMALSADDDMNPEQCAAALEGDSITQSQADRCATDPSMAWETLAFMTGGDYVASARCSAVTFAAVVAKGTNVDSCQALNRYNKEPSPPPTWATSVNDVCVDERVCSDAVLTALVDAVDQGSSSEMLADNTPGSGFVYHVPTKTTTAMCVQGYEAVSGTADYRCSHVPLTNNGGYAIDDTAAANVVQAGNSIGSWVGSLECEKRDCPPACGSELGDFITGDGALTQQRPPPEGLDDTCCSGVFGDDCQIKCSRGYAPRKSTGTLIETPMTCQVRGNDNQAEPEWYGASCSALQCYQAEVANEQAVNRPTASGHVGDLYAYDASAGSACAVGYFQVGALQCGTNLFYQGGGCFDRTVSGLTDDQFVSGTVTGSSNNNLARDVFDNDPLTYWFSTRQGPVTPADPDWLQVVIGTPIVPLGYSIQLGKSTDWLSFLIKPRAHQLRAKLSTAAAAPWFDYHQITDPDAAAAAAQWNPACNDITIDPFNCWAEETQCPSAGCDPQIQQIQCPSTSNCFSADRITPPPQTNCNYPSSRACGPTQFPIYAAGAGGAFDTFRLEFTQEFTETRPDNCDLADAGCNRYGQIYVQDVHIMSASEFTTTINGVVTTVTPRMQTDGGVATDLAKTCCSETTSTCTHIQLVDRSDAAACARAVSIAGGTIMQYVEGPFGGGGDCYNVETLGIDVGFPEYTNGDHLGAVCYDLA